MMAMRRARRGSMAMAARGFLAVAVLGALLGLPAPAHARHAAIQIVSMYMTTEPAYDAFGPHSPAPPRVTAFAFPGAHGAVDHLSGGGGWNTIVGVYIAYRGAQAHKTTYRVAIYPNGDDQLDFAPGSPQTFSRANGAVALLPPWEPYDPGAPYLMGAYTATLYVNGVATRTTRFSVVAAPTIDYSKMIDAQGWNHFNSHDPGGPPEVYCYPAGVDSVFAYYSYEGMAKTDRHYVAVYDAAGQQVYRSPEHGAVYDVAGQQGLHSQERATAGGYIAIRLPADAGHWPKGDYRTDLYINGAVVNTMTWSTPCSW